MSHELDLNPCARCQPVKMSVGATPDLNEPFLMGLCLAPGKLPSMAQEKQVARGINPDSLSVRTSTERFCGVFNQPGKQTECTSFIPKT